MMPFKIIDEQNEVIKNLKYKLQFSRNKVKDGKDINRLVNTLKCFDDMLVSKYKTDTIETLIYSLIYEILMLNKAYEKEIPLYDIINTIDTDIHYGNELKKKQVVDILKTHEMNNKINNGTVFNKDYANFDAMLTKLMNEFKQQVIWKKQ